MWIAITLGFLLAVGLLVLYAQAGRSVVEYFYMAVFAMLEGDHAAHKAMVAAGMTVAQNLRPKMLSMLMLIDDQYRNQLEPVKVLLSTKKWTIEDSIRAKRLLRAADVEYFVAISNWHGKANPAIFITRHPSLEKRMPFVKYLTDRVVE